MSLHPQAVWAIELAGDIPTGLTPAELRRRYDEQRLKLQPPRPSIAIAKEILIPTRDGAVPARFYSPGSDRRTRKLLVYFHGGGWMLGSLEGYETLCRRLALEAECAVLSVGYRLAPEDPYPAAVYDCVDAVNWCADNAAELHIDPARIAVGGDSAGGNLAAVVAQIAHDTKQARIALQVLIYAVTDATQESPSYERYASGFMLSRAAMRWFIQAYAPNASDRRDPKVSPLLRSDLRGLPPALVITAECDPLTDENAAYARRLEDAGIPVQYVCFPGMIHPFLTLGGVIDAAQEAERLIAEAIRKM